MSDPTLGPIKKVTGIAGQIGYAVDVTYAGERPERMAFVSSVYGGPIVMVLPSGQQLFVSQPERFGQFGPEWVRRFYRPVR